MRIIFIFIHIREYQGQEKYFIFFFTDVRRIIDIAPCKKGFVKNSTALKLYFAAHISRTAEDLVMGLRKYTYHRQLRILIVRDTANIVVQRF